MVCLRNISVDSPHKGDIIIIIIIGYFVSVCHSSYSELSRCGNINSSNAELNPICQLLALLEAHPILHASRVRINP